MKKFSIVIILLAIAVSAVEAFSLSDNPKCKMYLPGDTALIDNDRCLVIGDILTSDGHWFDWVNLKHDRDFALCGYEHGICYQDKDGQVKGEYASRHSVGHGLYLVSIDADGFSALGWKLVNSKNDALTGFHQQIIIPEDYDHDVLFEIFYLGLETYITVDEFDDRYIFTLHEGEHEEVIGGIVGVTWSCNNDGFGLKPWAKIVGKYSRVLALRIQDGCLKALVTKTLEIGLETPHWVVLRSLE